MSSRIWTEKALPKPFAYLGYFLLLAGIGLGLSVLVEQAQPLLDPDSLNREAPPAQVESRLVGMPGVRLLGDGFQAPTASRFTSSGLAQEQALSLRTYWLLARESRLVGTAPKIVAPATIPSRVQIPALGVDAQVVSVPFKDGTWDLWPVQFKIGYLERTGGLGEGNMVLAGHISIRGVEGPFRYLASLQPGDTVTLYYQDEVFTYRVREQKLVGPREVSILAPTQSPTLTLFTCENWDEERGYYVARRVVIAELVSQSR